jgi:hypothetical protein
MKLFQLFTSDKLSKEQQLRKREFSLVAVGLFSGFLLAILPLLAMTVTPGYLTGQIMFSQGGGTTQATVERVINTRVNDDPSKPLNKLVGEEGATTRNILSNQFGLLYGSSWTAGSLLLDIQSRLSAISQHFGTSSSGPVQISPGFGLGEYVAQDAGGTLAYPALRFSYSAMMDTTLETIVFDIVVPSGRDASQMLQSGALDVFDPQGFPIATFSAAPSNGQFVFTGLNFSFLARESYVFIVRVTPSRVITGRANFGDSYSLQLAPNAFSLTGTASVLRDTVTGIPLTPTTNGVFGGEYIIQRAIPVFNRRSLTSNKLASGKQEVLPFTLQKEGEGTIEIGSGLPDSNISLELKTVGTLTIKSCEIVDGQTGDVLADFPYQVTLTSGFQAYNFNEMLFKPGKRISGDAAGRNYSFVCDIDAPLSPLTSLEASVGRFAPSTDGVALIDSDTSIIDDTTKLFSLPLVGDTLVAP